MTQVTIVVPSYNCRRFVGATLDSVRRQTVPPSAVVVVDDGSTDGTGRFIAAQYPEVTYVRQDNAGVATARNRGLSMAATDWVMFLDADDVLAPTALDSLLRVATDDVVIYGNKTKIDEDGTLIEHVTNRDCTGRVPAAARACFGGAAFEPGCAIVPRRLAVELGGFDQRYAPCEDRHFWVRCGALTEFRHVPEVVMHYRVRPGSHSKNRARQVRASVSTRIDLLDWFVSRGIAVFDEAPDKEQILRADLEAVYWKREWAVVDELLDLADQHGIDSPAIRSVRRMRRVPRPVWAIKDAFDRGLFGRRRV